MLEGSATLTANDPERHGPPVTIVAGDMVTFPKNWSGVWEVHSFLRKVYAFFDREGLRVDEDIDEEEEDNSAPVGRGVGAPKKHEHSSSFSSFFSASSSRLRKKVREYIAPLSSR